jgi:imidazolonepropionase-like amidohydrolase
LHYRNPRTTLAVNKLEQIMRVLYLAVLFFGFGTWPGGPDDSIADTTIYLHAGRLIDVREGRVQTEMTLVIEADRIVAIEQGYVSPKPLANGENSETEIVDLRDYTVMPGLMDMHTHLLAQHHRGVYAEKFFMNDADFALRSVRFAEQTLLAGFTTVRDLGDNGTNSVALRKAISEGYVVGPRIFTSGKSIATTGGHGDPTNGVKGDFSKDAGPIDGVINGVDEARKAVRQRYKEGADLIKLTATGGVLSLAADGLNPQFTDEELAAIVEIAKDYGMTVAVHAHGTEGMKRAVLAGVDSIEHGTFMTPEIMRLMKERGTYYVPTISAGVWVAMKSEEPDYFPPIVRPKAALIGPQIRKTFADAHAAGLKIAFGTDSGVSPHGDNAQEFELMVEGGMSPMAAIQSATIVAAKLLRIDDRLGILEPGKIADVVAVKGDPLENISLMRQVGFVMKDGAVFKSAQHPKR